VVAGAFSIMFVTFGTACSALGRFTLASLADRIGTDATLRFQSIAEVALPIRTSFCVLLAAARRSRRS
jgi:hypothetical protein